MNSQLKKVILSEHSSVIKNRVIRWVGEDRKRFRELIDLVLKGDERMQQRASWPMSFVAERYPNLIKPHIKLLVMNLKNKGLHVAVKRNTLRLLQFVELPAALEGVIIKICYPFLLDPKETVAVRVFAMQIISNVSRKHPELQRELKIVLSEIIPHGSAGIRSRAKRILNNLNN